MLLFQLQLAKKYNMVIVSSILERDENHGDVLANTAGEINREYVYSVAVYQKYVTRLGELIIFKPWRENYRFFQRS